MAFFEVTFSAPQIVARPKLWSKVGQGRASAPQRQGPRAANAGRQRGFIAPLSMLAAALLGTTIQADVRRPNILFLIADDLGWNDVGYHGSEILTPNIDRLCREGVELDQHYVTPMCSSTRTCLLSGRFSTRFGVDSATNQQVFPPGMVTLATALRSVGYDTCITGKWHLGSRPEWGPLQYGFNRSHGSFAGGVDQYTHLYKRGKYSKTWHRNDQYIQEEGHTTDLLMKQAVEWIEAKRPPDQRFYIQVAFTAVHVPIQEPDEWVAPYEGRIDNPSRRRYAACATHMDHAIGQMVAALERSGQRETTLIVFTSDNGANPGPWKNKSYPGDHYDPCPVLGDNRPLRGKKGQVYEGGIRVPAFVNWPQVLKPSQWTSPLHMIDWMPTLCSIADCQMQDDYRWEGKNVWPLLAGQAPTPQPRTLYFKVDDDYAIRHGDWKLVKRDDASSELFNLKEDPFEQTNLVDRESDRAAHLFELLEKHRAMDGPPLGWQEPARWRRARATTRGGLCLRSANAPC